jgi:hypothetical protein
MSRLLIMLLLVPLFARAGMCEATGSIFTLNTSD